MSDSTTSSSSPTSPATTVETEHEVNLPGSPEVDLPGSPAALDYHSSPSTPEPSATPFPKVNERYQAFSDSFMKKDTAEEDTDYVNADQKRAQVMDNPTSTNILCTLNHNHNTVKKIESNGIAVPVIQLNTKTDENSIEAGEDGEVPVLKPHQSFMGPNPPHFEGQEDGPEKEKEDVPSSPGPIASDSESQPSDTSCRRVFLEDFDTDEADNVHARYRKDERDIVPGTLAAREKKHKSSDERQWWPESVLKRADSNPCRPDHVSIKISRLFHFDSDQKLLRDLLRSHANKAIGASLYLKRNIILWSSLCLSEMMYRAGLRTSYIYERTKRTFYSGRITRHSVRIITSRMDCSKRNQMNWPSFGSGDKTFPLSFYMTDQFQQRRPYMDLGNKEEKWLADRGLCQGRLELTPGVMIDAMWTDYLLCMKQKTVISDFLKLSIEDRSPLEAVSRGDLDYLEGKLTEDNTNIVPRAMELFLRDRDAGDQTESDQLTSDED